MCWFSRNLKNPNVIPVPSGREGLGKALIKAGKAKPKGTDIVAHHDATWTNKEWFAARGVNVNKAQYGRWVQGGKDSAHGREVYVFEGAWDYLKREKNLDNLPLDEVKEKIDEAILELQEDFHYFNDIR